MACRRMLMKQGTLLQRWYHPSLSHIVHRGDDSDKNFKSPSASRCGCGSDNFILPQIHNGSTRGGIWGFQGNGAISGQSRNLPTFLFASGVGPSLSRYMSSTIGKGYDNADHLGEIADILTDKTVEVVSSQAPAINEVAVAAADSAFPVAALQYLIDGVHTLTGLNWWAAIAITTILIRAAMLPIDINQRKDAYKPQLNIDLLRAAEMQKKFLQNSGMDDHMDIVDAAQKTAAAWFRYYGTHRGHIIHGSIFISFWFAISNMVEKVSSLKHGGAFWFLDLTTPDSLYMFPVLVSLLLLVSVQQASILIAVIAVPFTMGISKLLIAQK